MHDLIAGAASYGNRVAVSDAHGSTTYGALHARAERLAQALLARSASPADLGEARVAILVTPGADWVAALWAVWLAGGIAVPLSPHHPVSEWAYVLDDAEVAYVIAEQALADAVRGVPGSRAVIELAGASVHQGSCDALLPAVAVTRRALMLYTSGTTGRPKGVVHTHASLLAQVSSLVSAWEWTASDHTLLVLPLHHVHGVVNVVCCALAVGARLTVHARFESSAVWQVLTEDPLTLFHAVPTIWSRLLAAFDAASPETRDRWRAAVSGLRLLVSGSAALPVLLLERWRVLSGHVLLERYGMTEIGMALSNPLHGVRVPGHVGQPLPGVSVRAVTDTGDPVADGEPGALEVRGNTVMLEYWRRPDETAAAFHDGWFRTGDVGVLEETAGGASWRLLGRQSTDIIKTGGYKVSALEIEEALRLHPSVRECVVVGVPDEEWGERVAVAVEVADACTLSLDDVRGFLRERLAIYKVPSALVTPDALPRNAMGKVMKPAVRTLFT